MAQTPPKMPSKAPSTTPPNGEPSWLARNGRVAFWVVCAAGLAIRFYFLARLPRSTGDVVRHLYYGWLVWRQGISIADVPLNMTHYNIPMPVWADIPYSYPVMGLYFFTLLAGIWPTIFMAKAALTAIEAVNAWLIWQVTGRRWIGLIYWLCPLSIWWVSSEGQYEPLQNLFALLAIYLFMKRRPAWAFAMLALAIQVKLTAGALLPWMLADQWRRDRRGFAIGLFAFSAGFLPTLLTNFFYPAIAQPFHYTGTLKHNAYGWVILDQHTIGPNPLWIILFNEAISFSVFFLLAYGMAKSKNPWIYVPAVMFILFAKTSSKFLNWYWLIWPTMIAPIPDPKIRRWLWFLYPLLDLGALLRMFGNPVVQEGFLKQGFYKPDSVFKRIDLTR